MLEGRQRRPQRVVFARRERGARRVAVRLRRGFGARATRRRRRERRCGLVLQVAIDGRALALREFERVGVAIAARVLSSHAVQPVQPVQPEC